MTVISVKSLLEAGVHFGHRASRWNPKMAPYIHGKRNLIHIINLKETIKGIIRAYHFLSQITAEGHEVLFVGTKRQAKSVIKREALRCKMHYVSERWLGGTLTNFETIRKRLARLEELERMDEDGTLETFSKKMASSLRRERKKIQRNLEGIRNMNSLPSALIVVDPLKEHIAVMEAAKLNIPVIALMDTDSDPDVIDIPIPCNDDAMRSVEIICTKLTDAIVEGLNTWEEKKKVEEKKKQESAPAEGEGRRGQGGSKAGRRREGKRRSGGGGRRDRNDRNDHRSDRRKKRHDQQDASSSSSAASGQSGKQAEQSQPQAKAEGSQDKQSPPQTDSDSAPKE